MKKAALHNLGCKVNAYETEAMQQILENAGYEIVPFTEIADVYVINTCSVTNMADRKSRQMFHRAKKMNPDAIVVGAGCYVQTKEAQAILDESIDIVIGNNQKHELVTLLNEYEKEHAKQAQIVDINHEKQEYEELHLKKTAEHTRAFIKVQDGCNQFCSYCIIPFARGRVRSRKMEDVLNEIAGLAESGYKEVVLTGIHLSSYGVDTGETLLSLIEHVHEIEGIERIRLGSLEPRIVTEDFAKTEKLGDTNPDFMAAVHDLTSTNCASFNEEVKNVPGIYYQSFGSKLNRPSSGRFPLNLSYLLVKRFDGPNDGLVGEKSFAWGEDYQFLTVKGKRGISHGDVIDLNREDIPGFDVREFYVQLVSKLKERGL